MGYTQLADIIPQMIHVPDMAWDAIIKCTYGYAGEIRYFIFSCFTYYYFNCNYKITEIIIS